MPTAQRRASNTTRWLITGGGGAALLSAGVFATSLIILRDPRSSGVAKTAALPLAAPSLVSAGVASVLMSTGLMLWLVGEEREP